MTFSKYIIHHLDLSAHLEPVQDVRHAAHYCVFWYGSVPLGEVYLLSKDIATPQQFWDACIKAITPALTKYGLQNNVSIPALWLVACIWKIQSLPPGSPW